MDPRPLRTMVDMGMGNMASMKRGGMAGMNMSGVDGMKEKDMPAPGKNTPDKQGMAGMKMGSQSMAGMDMGTSAAKQNMPTGHTNEQAMTGMEMGSSDGTTPFPQPGPNTMPIMPMPGTGSAEANLKPSTPVHMHVGPQVVSVPMQVSERLNDPGDGLNDNGRRVLPMPTCAPATVGWMGGRRLVRSNCTFQETWSATSGDSMVRNFLALNQSYWSVENGYGSYLSTTR
jgi:hypothetical protein